MAADVAALVTMFEDSETATMEARRLSERDRDYYDNKQWDASEEATLRDRKQPVVTYNRVQRKVNYLSGMEKQQRKDPKAFPVTPDDEEAATAATDALRFICQKEEWDRKRSSAWRHLLIEGTAAILVDVKQTRQGFDPAITAIAWDRFFYDPKSCDPMFDDARYMGIVTWYDLDEAMRKWPDAKDALAASIETQGTETYEDKPRTTWGDTRTKRVRVCEIYYREQVWMRCVFTKGGHVEPPMPSPYLDENRAPENPIKAASLHVDRDNNRYGDVRVLISPQDVINKTHSKWMHFNNMRQVRVSPVAQQRPEKIRRELARPDGVVVGEKDDFEILPTGDLAAAQFNMLQVSMNEIDALGANAALQGKNEADMSGRAIMAQQQGGMVEVADSFDVLRELTLRVYRAIWNRVRQVWTGERWVRVTDDERNLRFVGLNQQVTVRQIAEEVAKGDPQGMQSAVKLVGTELMQAFMQGDPQAQAALGLFVQQNADRVVETRNAVNELDVDIVIDEGMDTPTAEAEQFDTLTKIIPGIVNLPPQYAKMLVMASAFRDKDQIIDMLEESQQADPMAAQMAQIQFAGAQAEVEKTQSETAKNYAQAQAADPQAEMALETAKAEHAAGLAEQKQMHGMMLAERGQMVREQQMQQRPQVA